MRTLPVTVIDRIGRNFALHTPRGRLDYTGINGMSVPLVLGFVDYKEVSTMHKVMGNGPSAFQSACAESSEGIRVLAAIETEEVGGGILPALGFASAILGHTGVMAASGGTISMGLGFAAHIASGFGLGYAAYSLGNAYGGAARSKRGGLSSH